MSVVLNPLKQSVNCATLAAYNATLDECQSCHTLERGFRHVPGGGNADQPLAMFVFINPTVRNISAAAEWPGPRLPFAGHPKLWQILAESGWIDAAIPQRIRNMGSTPEMVKMLIEESRRREVYLTNAVKCVDDGSSLPAVARVAAQLPVLQTEIALVRPRHLITFGLIPFRALTGRTVRLADALWAARHGRPESYPSLAINGRVYPVFPVYFPTGRGNPIAARDMLHSIRKALSSNCHL